MGSGAEGGGHRSPGVLDVDPTSSRVVADLRHPHLTTMKSVHPSGVEPDIGSGASLAELIEAGVPPLRISLRILLDVLSGVAAIHHARMDGKPIGFVHGEVAPANIIVGRDGVARLVPLSSGEGAGQSTLVGYQAPELLLGDAVDQRADVFSAGVLLWEAMSGTRLFRDTPVEEIVTQLIGGKVHAPPTPREAPWSADLAAVAMKAIDVDPTQRWPHVGALGATIETIAHSNLATPAELATFVARALGGDSRASFSDEVTAKRRALPEVAAVSAPESLSAVSTPVFPEPAPLVAPAPAPAPFDLVSIPSHPPSADPPTSDWLGSAVPPSPEQPRALDFATSSPDEPLPVHGMSVRRRWTLVSALLVASAVLALVAARKLARPDGARGAAIPPGSELAQPAAAAATPREARPPTVPVASATAAPTVAAKAAEAPKIPEAVSPSASTPPKPAIVPAKVAPSPGSPVRASPSPAPTAPAQKPKPAADQFGI